MCERAYDSKTSMTSKTMIFCHLKDKEKTDFKKLCVSQKYCIDTDRFVALDQRRDCKYFK